MTHSPQPLDHVPIFAHRPLSDAEVAYMRAQNDSWYGGVHPEPDRSLHVISMALAAISGALVGFVIRGLL